MPCSQWLGTVQDPDNPPANLTNTGAGTIGLAPETLVNGVGLPAWVRFGATVLPHTQITSLSYTPQQTIGGTVRATGGVLVVGTLGRGTWKLDNANSVLAAESTLVVNGTAVDDQYILRLSAAHPSPLDQWVEVVTVDGTTVVPAVPEACSSESLSIPVMAMTPCTWIAASGLPAGSSSMACAWNQPPCPAGRAGRCHPQGTGGRGTGQRSADRRRRCDCPRAAWCFQKRRCGGHQPAASGPDNLLAKMRAGLTTLTETKVSTRP